MANTLMANIIMKSIETSNSIFDDLPDETLVEIFKQMDLHTLLSTSRVCVRFHAIINEANLVARGVVEKPIVCKNGMAPSVIDFLTRRNNKDAVFISALIDFEYGRIVSACMGFNKYFNVLGGTPMFHSDGTCVLGACVLGAQDDDVGADDGADVGATAGANAHANRCSATTASCGNSARIYFAIAYIHRIECYHLRLTICDRYGNSVIADRALIWRSCRNLAKYDPEITKNSVRFADTQSCASFRRQLTSDYPICVANSSVILDEVRTSMLDHPFSITMG
jgi:hypothetical protein